jgi:hypothetical protein
MANQPSKNKGGQKARASEEQLEWLTSMLPSYMTSRASTAPGDFWPGGYETWFAKWPLEGPSAEEQAQGVDEAAKSRKKKAVSKKRIVQLIWGSPSK